MSAHVATTIGALRVFLWGDTQALSHPCPVCLSCKFNRSLLLGMGDPSCTMMQAKGAQCVKKDPLVA